MEFQNPQNKRVMIVIVGLPCTGKSEIAKHLGKWVPTSVLYIDDFLCALSLEKGYTVESPPSSEEAERLYNVAFDSLCNVASLDDRCFKRCVIIKCRFDSEFERRRLVRLSEEAHYRRIIIIECWIENKHRWRNRVKDKERKHWEWYKPGSWEDIDEAKEIFHHWSYCYGKTLLFLDPFEDLNLHTKRNKHLLHELSSSLLDAINFLMGDDGHGHYYFFDELRRSLLEKKLEAAASRERSKYVCTSRCIFKYWDKLGDEDNDYKCGVCDDQVASGQPAYTCYYCILALHKSCAELHGLHRRLDAPFCFPETYPCRSCKEGGKGFSGECTSCLFQTHLKCRLVPAIIKHECHAEHFLSLNFSNDMDVVCIACGVEPFSYAYGCSAYIFYGCYICNRFYDIRCASLTVELKHGHGGYEHVTKLKYYCRDIWEEEKEESYWCDICYKDMDPQYWFYMCQECPYYAAHTRCVVPLNEYEEWEDKKYYESISLEDVDSTNDDEEEQFDESDVSEDLDQNKVVLSNNDDDEEQFDESNVSEDDD